MSPFSWVDQQLFVSARRQTPVRGCRLWLWVCNPKKIIIQIVICNIEHRSWPTNLCSLKIKISWINFHCVKTGIINLSHVAEVFAFRFHSECHQDCSTGQCILKGIMKGLRKWLFPWKGALLSAPLSRLFND